MGGAVKKAATTNLGSIDSAWKTNVANTKAAANTNWQNTVDAAQTNANTVGQVLADANMQVSSNLGAGLDSFTHAMDVNMANLTGRSLDQKKPLTTSSENYSNAAAKRKKGGSGGNKAADLRAGGKNRLQGKRALYKTKPSQ